MSIGRWNDKKEMQSKIPHVTLETKIPWNPDITKGQGTGKNLFAITRFRYIEVRFHIFYYYGGKENRALSQGLRYIEVRYIEIPLPIILIMIWAEIEKS